MIAERSAKSKFAKSVFYEEFNDVDVYIEDTSVESKKLYKILLNRALDGRVHVDSVFPLGGKSEVINACVNHQSSNNRPSVYILDGDLDLLDGTYMSCHDRLYVLRRYCIENYLIDEKAAVAVLDEEDIERDEDQLEKEFDFPRWKAGNEDTLFELFTIYALCKRYLPSVMTVKYPINKLVSSNNGIIDINKSTQRIDKLTHKLAEELGYKRVEEEKKRIVDEAKTYWVIRLVKYISGKDYLLPLLLMRLRRTTRLRADNRVIKLRLAMKCGISELRDVGEYIKST